MNWLSRTLKSSRLLYNIYFFVMSALLKLLGLDGFAGQGTGFFGFMLYDYGGILFFYALFSRSLPSQMIPLPIPVPRVTTMTSL